jgi:tRNA (cytidine/uridine-2'-O-)-methyltransferase
MEERHCIALARLSVILVEPEVAANTGSIGRTCVAAGATLWLVRPLGFLLDERHLRRAALDCWEHLDLRVVNSLGEAEQAVGAQRLWYFSTEERFRWVASLVAARTCRLTPTGGLGE